MEEFEKKYLLKRQDYGLLYPYIVSDDVTDINWNGRQLWIDDLGRGRFLAGEVLPEAFVDRFASLISSVVSLPFNKRNPVLEAEKNYEKDTSLSCRNKSGSNFLYLQ